MKTCTINRYAKGEHAEHDIVLTDHVTITGDEDHFALAVHDARMIIAGCRLADPEAIWRIKSIDIR